VDARPRRSPVHSRTRIHRVDVLIEDGIIVDGLGGPGRRGHVTIANGRIAAVGNGDGAVTAGTVIDASGCVVAPGFIDLLAHSEFSVLAHPGAVGKVTQGVTLEVNGEGVGAVPCTGAAAAVADERAAVWGVRRTWSRFAGYRAALHARRPALLTATMVAGGQLRACVPGGCATTALSARARDRLLQLLDEELSAGAAGLSMVLEEPPGSCYTREELVDLCTVVRSHGRLFSVHVRDEGERLLDAVAEVLDIARDTGVRTELLHLKVPSGHQARRDELIEMVRCARRGGVDVGATVYPYLHASLAMRELVPGVGVSFGAPRRHDVRRHRRLAHAIERHPRRPEWSETFLATPPWVSVATLAEQERRAPSAVAAGLITAGGERDICSAPATSEESLSQLLSEPWVSVASDGFGRPPGVRRSRRVQVHPRDYGTFPRLFRRYVRELGVLTVGEAVRRVTHLPATRLGVAQRGCLAAGAHADVAVFDPATFADAATYAQPHRLATGLRALLVGGEVVVSDGRPTGRRPGGAVVFGEA
jgi:N-acyl-D-amino-acid deacylase